MCLSRHAGLLPAVGAAPMARDRYADPANAAGLAR
jgi:hypothetical protein